MSDKEPIRPAGAQRRAPAAAHGPSAKHDYAQTRFHAVQVLRHVPPPPAHQRPQTPSSVSVTASSAPRASGSTASGVFGGEGNRGWDEASLFDAAGERAMLSAADAAAAATAMMASRNAEKERTRRGQEELRRARASKAALWLKKQQESRQVEQALDATTAGQRLGRKKTAWEAGNAQVHRAQHREASEREARRKEDDLLDALLGHPNLPPDDPSEEEEEEGGEDDDGIFAQEGGDLDSLDADQEARDEEEVENMMRIRREEILRRYRLSGSIPICDEEGAGEEQRGGAHAADASFASQAEDTDHVRLECVEDESEDARRSGPRFLPLFDLPDSCLAFRARFVSELSLPATSRELQGEAGRFPRQVRP